MKRHFLIFRKRDIGYLAALLPIILLGIYGFERAQVWLPTHEMRESPAEKGLTFEDVYFQTHDGLTLNGWYFPSPQSPKASILFCHGNGGNLSGQYARVFLLQPLHLNFFIFDYRGYGKSQGYPTEKGTYQDALAAYAWLKNRTPNLPMILHGWSLGAAIATDLATTTDACALISENGFTSIPNVGKDRFPILPIHLLSWIHYNAVAKIKQIHIPVLIIHSPDDQTVPYHHGKELFEAAPEPKTMVSLAGGHDCAFVSEKEYQEAITQFLEQFALKTNISK